VAFFYTTVHTGQVLPREQTWNTRREYAAGIRGGNVVTIMHALL
jgi:hypothetical protein